MTQLDCPYGVTRHCAHSYVTVSRVAGVDMWATAEPLSDAVLYAKDMPSGAPPLILSRIWDFGEAKHPAKIRAAIGAQDSSATRCADVYFGYYTSP